MVYKNYFLGLLAIFIFGFIFAGFVNAMPQCNQQMSPRVGSCYIDIDGTNIDTSQIISYDLRHYCLDPSRCNGEVSITFSPLSIFAGFMNDLKIKLSYDNMEQKSNLNLDSSKQINLDSKIKNFTIDLADMPSFLTVNWVKTGDPKKGTLTFSFNTGYLLRNNGDIDKCLELGYHNYTGSDDLKCTAPGEVTLCERSTGSLLKYKFVALDGTEDNPNVFFTQSGYKNNIDLLAYDPNCVLPINEGCNDFKLNAGPNFFAKCGQSDNELIFCNNDKGGKTESYIGQIVGKEIKYGPMSMDNTTYNVYYNECKWKNQLSQNVKNWCTPEYSKTLKYDLKYKCAEFDVNLTYKDNVLEVCSNYFGKYAKYNAIYNSTENNILFRSDSKETSIFKDVSITLNEYQSLLNNCQWKTDLTANTKPVVNSKDSNWCSVNYGSEWKSLSKYGLGSSGIVQNNMLSFNYGKSSLTATDCSRYFCDAEQFATYLQAYTKVNQGEGIYINQIEYFLKPSNGWSKSNINLHELSIESVLDPISLYYVNDLKTKLMQRPYKREVSDYFFTITRDLPNLYFKVPVGNSYCKYSNTDKLDYCYVLARNMDTKSELEEFLSRNSKFDFVIFARNGELEYFALNKTTKLAGNKIFKSQLSTIYSYKVYLKPDAIRTFVSSPSFLNTNYLHYVVDDVYRPGAYILYPYSLGGDKSLKLFHADQYIPDYVTNDFLYNLVLSPDARPLGYTGEYGLCISNGKLQVNPSTLITMSDCSNSMYSKVNVTSANVDVLSFTSTPVLTAASFNLTTPNCLSNCVITYAGNKTISFTKEDYYLENIFKYPENYCYKQTSSELDIKYRG